MHDALRVNIARELASDPTLAVAREILIHGPISRTELAHRLSLSPPTLTRVVKPLLSTALLEERRERADGLGRPSKPLSFRANAHHFMGIKLTSDRAVGVITDLRAAELAGADVELQSNDPDAVVKDIGRLVRILKPQSPGPVRGLGVAIGGSASDGRIVDRETFLGWGTVPLAQMIEDREDIPVVVDNDLLALTAAEHWFGVAAGSEDFAVVTVGAGVGLGLVARDRVVRARNAGLGLAGHIPLDDRGPVCMVGHRGCSTAMLSIGSIESQYAVSSGDAVPYREILRRSRSGEALAVALLRPSAAALGRLVALVANLSMVDLVVIGGEGADLMDVHADAFADQLRHDRDPDATPLDIRRDFQGFKAWARGAAAVAIQASLPGFIRER